MNAIFLQLHGLASGCIHRHAVLALVGFNADVALPLALEIALLGGDALAAAEQAVAADHGHNPEAYLANVL